MKKTLEVGINHLALPLQRLDLPCELKPPLKPLIRREVLEVEGMGRGVQVKGSGAGDPVLPNDLHGGTSAFT